MIQKEEQLLFDECVEDAKVLGRKHMAVINKKWEAPTKEEFQLAIALFLKRVRDDV